MRTVIAKVTTALGALCLAGMSLHAQGHESSAKIPFSFQVAGKTMPAGAYRFTYPTGSPVAQVRNMKSGNVIFVTTRANAGKAAARNTIVFHCYGNEHFLAKIWTPSGASQDISVSKREKELKMGSNTVAASLVSIQIRAD